MGIGLENAIAKAEDKGQARANALDSVAELKRTLPAFNQSREMKNAVEEYERYIKQEIDKCDLLCITCHHKEHKIK